MNDFELIIRMWRYILLGARGGKMVRILVKMRLLICLLGVTLASGFNVAAAQDAADSLNGYWKQKGSSVYIQIISSEAGYEAEMVRNDWAPGLVGTKYFENVVPVNRKKNRWTGDTAIPNSSRSGKATLRMNNDGELTIRLRPGGRFTWKRTEPVEKRY